MYGVGHWFLSEQLLHPALTKSPKNSVYISDLYTQWNVITVIGMGISPEGRNQNSLTAISITAPEYAAV